MSSLKPKGEKIRQAVKWISEKIKEGKGVSLESLVEKASLKFNLSPKEEEFLRSFYQEAGDRKDH